MLKTNYYINKKILRIFFSNDLVSSTMTVFLGLKYSICQHQVMWLAIFQES